MEKRYLRIGRWHVEFFFATDGYDTDTIIDRMYDFGASPDKMRQAMDLMSKEEMNTGFIFTNELEYLALVVIGPTSNGEEFINTLVHEIHHLAVAIASNLGIDLEGEGPAYLAGDSAHDMAEAICRLGCRSCR